MFDFPGSCSGQGIAYSLTSSSHMEHVVVAASRGVTGGRAAGNSESAEVPRQRVQDPVFVDSCGSYEVPCLRWPCLTARAAQATPTAVSPPAAKKVAASGRSVRNASADKAIRPPVDRKAAAARKRPRRGIAMKVSIASATMSLIQSGATQETSRAPPNRPAKTPAIAVPAACVRLLNADESATGPC